MATSQTAVVTGAGSGLGRGLCLELARDGYSVVAVDKNLTTAAETVAMLPRAELGQAYELDVSSREGVARFAEAMSACRVDVLINNAGLQHVAAVEAFPEEKWRELVDVILGGAFAMMRVLLPGMRQRNFGRIVNIGSIHSLVASPYKSAYVAAKHGLLGLAKVVALETADADITVNTICPAYIRTPLVDAQIADQARIHGISEEQVISEVLLAPMPKKCFVTIEEIAGAVRFLIGPHARNITGESLTIDGGWTAR